LTRDEIVEKFRAAARGVLTADKISAALEFVADLENQPTLEPLLRAVRP
jgi:hypothetical protein